MPASRHFTALSNEISSISLHSPLPLPFHLYIFPFIFLYPAAIYTYFFRYEEVIADQANTFIGCVLLFGSHALSWLSTRWSSDFRAKVTSLHVTDIDKASLIKITPVAHRGQPEITALHRDPTNGSISFDYQRDKFVLDPKSNIFSRLAYPCDNSCLTLAQYQSTKGLTTKEGIDKAKLDYGKNHFDIPIPTFRELFAEHAQAPFFVFQIFCVGLWCLDEYWYYSIFTLFMLVVFECTVVFQRQRTLNEFRTMSIKPYNINVYRNLIWTEIQTDDLLPGDLVSIVRSKEESGLPCDLLLLQGACIVNEAMLSGESTPLLKESIELRTSTESLDMAGTDKNSLLFGGTKTLQATSSPTLSDSHLPSPPDDGCLAVTLKTGFGTSQGQLIRTMIFSTERISANNLESFLFIVFLLCFAIAASAYVWIKGVENDRKRTKLLLDCVIIITSVVPPELPMELSLAVNGSLVALSKLAIFCTEPFRIPFAGRVDVCCFDKTGTLTGEDLVVEGVAGTNSETPRQLIPVTSTTLETTLTLASAHALVLLEDGLVGDPMEKTTLESLNWRLGKGDILSPASPAPLESESVPIPRSNHNAQIAIKRRFQFSSALKRMSTVSSVIQSGSQKKRTFVAVKGAPETLKQMYTQVPQDYETTYKWFAQRGSRVLSLGYKYMDETNGDKISKVTREQVESELHFAGFLVFHCPLKPDAIQTLKMLNDSSHRCIMITGDNPLTAAHVARDVEIVDRDVMILDLREGAVDESDIVWRTVDDRKVISAKSDQPLDMAILESYDLCMTGAALKQYASTSAWQQLVQHTWVYARVSPAQKEYILTTLRELGYTTLMAGDGTNDVGALKQAHIGVALLNGTLDDLKKIAEHQKIERFKKVYESQLKLSQRFNAPPPPVPAALAQHFPDVVEAQKKAKEQGDLARRGGDPRSKFDLSSLTNKLSEMDDDNEPPTIKLGDASVAAPFTSKLSHVQAITHIIRQGRCTLVATTQMYKILALNCLISAYSLSVQYLDGIKFGDYQVTITGMLMSVCFLCISRARPIEKLSKERPLSNIFNPYIVSSVLLQFSIHIVALLYMTWLCNVADPRSERVDLEAEFKPSLLNSAVYLISLSQQVSTFAVNFQGRPFREGITENSALYYGLLSVAGVAICGATDFIPELNRWLQLVEMDFMFRVKLTATMILDYGGAWAVNLVLKKWLADVSPKPIIMRGLERREARRAIEMADEVKAIAEKKTS